MLLQQTFTSNFISLVILIDKKKKKSLVLTSSSSCLFLAMWQLLVHHQSSSMFYEVYQLASWLVSARGMGNSSSRVVHGLSNDA